MTALDWVLLLIVGVSGLLGLLRGMIGVVVSLVAWLLAGAAAYLFGGDVGRGLVTDGQPGWGEYLGGFALSFAVVWIAVGLVGVVIRRLVHGVGLSGVARLFGCGLGVVRGLFFACVLLLLLGLTGVPDKRAWHESAGVATLLPVAKLMRGALPPWMAQRIDLEGRGNSLQAEAERLTQAMPEALPAPITEALTDGALAEGIPQAFLPRATETAPRSTQESTDPTLVTPDPPSQGTPPDDARVL